MLVYRTQRFLFFFKYKLCYHLPVYHSAHFVEILSAYVFYVAENHLHYSMYIL